MYFIQIPSFSPSVLAVPGPLHDATCLFREWQFLRFSLFLMNLTVFKSTGRVFCKMTLSWSSSGGFLMVRLGQCALGMKAARVRRHSPHPVPRIPVSAWLTTEVRWSFPDFSTLKLIFPPFSYWTFWEWVTKHPTPKEGSYTFLRREYLLKLFGVLLYEIYSAIDLWHNGIVDIYLILWVII